MPEEVRGGVLTTDWRLLATARPLGKTAGIVASPGEDWSHADHLLHPQFNNKPRLVAHQKEKAPQAKKKSA